MIRNLVAADIAAATDLQRRVYKTVPAFQAEQFKSLPDHFPKGQFAAEMDGQLAGLAISLVASWDDYSPHHSWANVTNNGLSDTRDMGGRTLYGAEVCVDPDSRGQGVGHLLYEARRRLCRAMNLNASSPAVACQAILNMPRTCPRKGTPGV